MNFPDKKAFGLSGNFPTAWEMGSYLLVNNSGIMADDYAFVIHYFAV